MSNRRTSDDGRRAPVCRSRASAFRRPSCARHRFAVAVAPFAPSWSPRTQGHRCLAHAAPQLHRQPMGAAPADGRAARSQPSRPHHLEGDIADFRQRLAPRGRGSQLGNRGLCHFSGPVDDIHTTTQREEEVTRRVDDLSEPSWPRRVSPSGSTRWTRCRSSARTTCPAACRTPSSGSPRPRPTSSGRRPSAGTARPVWSASPARSSVGSPGASGAARSSSAGRSWRASARVAVRARKTDRVARRSRHEPAPGPPTITEHRRLQEHRRCTP